MASLSTWISIEVERPWASNILFVFRVFDVCKLWSLGLSCKMELNFFLSIIDASVNLASTFPLRRKKKKKQTNKPKKCWIYGLKTLRCCFSETRGSLAFYVTALSEYVHLMFLRICLKCYFLKRTSLTVIMKQLKLMLWKFVWQNPRV